nr:hypothetical protein [Tanacetum cinerariifolium]
MTWQVYGVTDVFGYGVTEDVMAERKPSAPSHPFNANERNSPSSCVSILKSSKTNNAMSDQEMEASYNDSYESESSDDEEDAEDDMSQSGDKVTADNDVERVCESSFMHNNDLLYDNNHKNKMSDKDIVLSEAL